jgi:hypothetical protein
LLRANVGFTHIMDKLASHSIWAISVCAKLLAKLGLVENRHFSFDHHMILAMGE